MTDEEFEKKNDEMVDRTVKEMADLRRAVEDANAMHTKAQEDLDDIKKKFIDEEYMKTSDFKTKIATFEAKMDEIDEELKRMKRPALGPGDEKEEKAAAVNTWFKNVHFTALKARESDYSDYFLPAEEEMKRLKTHEKQFVEGQMRIPKWTVDAETKAAIVTDHMVRAGAIVGMPEYIVDIIDQAVREISPIRKHSKVKRVTRTPVEQPAKTAHAIAYFPGKEAVGTATEDTALAYALEKIPVHLQVVLWKVSQSMLEDSIFNLNAEFMEEMTGAIDAGEGTAFVNGTGSHEPMGFMVDPEITQELVQGHASLIHNADALKKLPWELKDEYSKNGKYYFKRASFSVITVLKDGVGNYLLRPLGEKTPWTINGFECVPTPDMPTIAGGAYPVVFADLKKGYLIVDKVTGVQLITDNITSKTTDVVEFLLRRRVGGMPVNPESFVKLKIATS